MLAFMLYLPYSLVNIMDYMLKLIKGAKCVKFWIVDVNFQLGLYNA
jgi:hypothetical protein